MRMLLIAVAGLLLTACAGPMDLQTRFYEVALYDEVAGQEQPIIKRSQNIRLLVDGGTSADRAQINGILERVSDATGLRVVAAPSWAAANLRVEFVSDQRWKRFMATNDRPAVCAVLFDVHGRNSDPLAVALIPNRHQGHLRAQCIAQETAHGATGLLNDTPNRRDTVFGDTAGATDLTAADMALMRVLYDSRIKAGMTWAEARPHVKAIVAEMEAAGQL